MDPWSFQTVSDYIGCPALLQPGLIPSGEVNQHETFIGHENPLWRDLWAEISRRGNSSSRTTCHVAGVGVRKRGRPCKKAHDGGP